MPGYQLANGTLKNRLGIEDADELEVVLATFSEARRIEILSGAGPVVQFNTDHLAAIHHQLFQDVFEWAGHTRDQPFVFADGSIGTDEQNFRRPGSEPFVSGEAIPEALAEIDRKLKEDGYLRELPRNVFAEKAADLLVNINNVHSFREGNGRTQRLFIEQIAEQAGHNLSFDYISQERMIQASIAAHEENDHSMMHRIFDESINPDRVAMLKSGTEFLQSRGFDWNNVYVATFQPGQPTEVLLSNILNTEFVARTENAVLIGNIDDLPDQLPERGVRTTINAKDRSAPAQDWGDLDPLIAKMLDEGSWPVEPLAEPGIELGPEPDHDPTPQPRRGRRR